MRDGITRRTTLAALAGATPLLQASSGATPSPAAPFVRTHGALERLRDPGSGLRNTGAVGDGHADDTQALQEIFDYYARVGGEWHLPPGIYRTSAPILWNCTRSQRLVGRGKRQVYPGLYTPAVTSELAVLLPVHTGRAAIRFTGSRDGDGSIELRDLALATLETGAVPIAALAWDVADHFLRDFAFINCSVHGYTAAFDLFRSGGRNNQMGLFRAERCTINRNRWIARTLDGTHWNGFFFRDSEAGQNGYLPGDGGIEIAAHNAVISGNSLEGQRNPVKLAGTMRSISVIDNYFEANVGTAAIHLQSSRGPFTIGPNSFIDCDPEKLDHLVLLSDCGPGQVLGPYWADGVHKIAPPILGGGRLNDNSLNRRLGSKAHGLLRLDGFDNRNGYTCEPRCTAIAKQRVAIAGRELAPWNGQPMPVAEHSTANSPEIALDLSLSGGAGDWVAMSWLFRRDPDVMSPADPMVSLLVNGSKTLGGRDYIARNFDEYWLRDEWCLLTAAIRLETALTRFGIRLFPFGASPPPARATRYLNPVAYVVNSVTEIRPFIDDYIARSVTTAPRTDEFKPGDMLLNAAINQAGQAHFVKISGSSDRWVYG